MTAPSALELLNEVRRVGGFMQPNPNGTLGVDLPPSATLRLLPLIRQRKTDLLMLLAEPDGPCPACNQRDRWLDAVGQWHCMMCAPNPAWRYLRGVTLEVLCNRAITLQPPTADLGAPGSWARTPNGNAAELVLYEATGAEVLMRSLKGERLAWFRPEDLSWEIDWGWRA